MRISDWSSDVCSSDLPGLVTHSTNIVEHPELVAERLTRYAGIVGRENVLAGTDCGFAQSPFARRVHPTIKRSEEGRVGTEWVSTCRYRCQPEQSQQKVKHTIDPDNKTRHNQKP